MWTLLSTISPSCQWKEQKNLPRCVDREINSPSANLRRSKRMSVSTLCVTALSQGERLKINTSICFLFLCLDSPLLPPPCVLFLAGNSSLRNLSLFINALLSVTMAMLKESVMAKRDHKRITFIFILNVSTNKQINKMLQLARVTFASWETALNEWLPIFISCLIFLLLFVRVLFCSPRHFIRKDHSELHSLNLKGFFATFCYHKNSLGIIIISKRSSVVTNIVLLQVI